MHTTITRAIAAASVVIALAAPATATMFGNAFPAPVGVAVTCDTVSGTLPAGDYYYEVTGGTPSGLDGLLSAEVHGHLASAGKCTVTWTAMPSAPLFVLYAPQGYHLYRGTTPGGEDSNNFDLDDVPNRLATSFVDDGAKVWTSNTNVPFQPGGVMWGPIGDANTWQANQVSSFLVASNWGFFHGDPQFDTLYLTALGTNKALNVTGPSVFNGQVFTTVPVTYNHSGTEQTGVHVVYDTATLSTGTVTVTLTGASVFTTASSYRCTASDDTALQAVGVTQTSGTSITFTGTASDVVSYICVGN